MALLNFDRSYELVVEDPLDITPPTEGEPTVKNEGTKTINAESLSDTTANGLKITELHIDVQISSTTKTSGSDSTIGEIKIFNLNDENRKRVSRINSPVILSAGYRGDNKIIFVGQVYKALSYKNGGDIITHLSCKAGWTPLTGIRYTQTISEGTYETVFKDIIDTFKKNGIVPIEAIKFDKAVGKLESPSSAKLTKGWTYNGFVRQALDALCEEFRYKWQIVHSKLWIYPENEDSYVEALQFNEGNVLSIRPAEDGSNVKSTMNQTESKTEKLPTSGFEMKVLLEGSIDETKQIILDAEEESSLFPYNGSYKVENYKHDLSYEGNAWYTTVRCLSLENTGDTDG